MPRTQILFSHFFCQCFFYFLIHMWFLPVSFQVPTEKKYKQGEESSMVHRCRWQEILEMTNFRASCACFCFHSLNQTRRPGNSCGEGVEMLRILRFRVVLQVSRDYVFETKLCSQFLYIHIKFKQVILYMVERNIRIKLNCIQ